MNVASVFRGEMAETSIIMLAILLLDFIMEIIDAFNMIIRLQLLRRNHKMERRAVECNITHTTCVS